MTDESVAYLGTPHGWQIGVGATVVVGNKHVARQLTSSARKDTACAFICDQQAPMASLSIAGTRISRIKR